SRSLCPCPFRRLDAGDLIFEAGKHALALGKLRLDGGLVRGHLVDDLLGLGLLCRELLLGRLGLGTRLLKRRDALGIPLVDVAQQVPRGGELLEAARAQKDVEEGESSGAVDRAGPRVQGALEVVDDGGLLGDPLAGRLDVAKELLVLLARLVVLLGRYLDLGVQLIDLSLDLAGLLPLVGRRRRESRYNSTEYEDES
ncbi:MAG: hypothetical protein K0B85_09380, partial [Coriobacteriia bacterium]|nr:hypothetical protein [Coriobacteriia bacterium]